MRRPPQTGLTVAGVCSLHNQFADVMTLIRCLVILFAIGLQFAAAQESSHSLYLNTGRLDTTASVALRQAGSSRAGSSAELIQFAGPIQPDWYEALQKTGVQIVSYVPDNAYLVYGDAAAVAQAASRRERTATPR